MHVSVLWCALRFVVMLNGCLGVMALSWLQADELTFDEGETLYILDMSDPDWWKAKCGNKTGLIPSNYGNRGLTFTLAES